MIFRFCPRSSSCSRQPIGPFGLDYCNISTHLGLVCLHKWLMSRFATCTQLVLLMLLSLQASSDVALFADFSPYRDRLRRYISFLTRTDLEVNAFTCSKGWFVLLNLNFLRECWLYMVVPIVIDLAHSEIFV